MASPLLIASIFGPSEHNHLWYRLQRQFVAANTDLAYDYRVFLNGVDPAGFEPAHVAYASRENTGHSHALSRVLETFRGDRHASYLVLDSDCFPILHGWHAALTGTMKRFGKTFAAPVRYENLDAFPHPCAFFLVDEALDDERLTFTKQPSKNLLGESVCDVGTGLRHMQDAGLPLLRTNQVNVHPVAAAIYHGMFYHHGAGSREFIFRVSKRFAYNDHWWPPSRDLEIGAALVARLERNPDAFLACLSGDLNACAEGEGEKPVREPLVAIVRRAWEAGREADLRGIYRRSPASEPPDYYFFLYGLCRTLNVTSVLEIGTDRGGSVLAMRKAIGGEAGQLVTVDLTDESDAQLAGRGDIVKIRGDAVSPEVIAAVLARLAAPVDVLYIDTEHDFKTTLAAWSTYAALLRPRVIVFDDITLNEEMRRFWALMLATYGDRAIDATSIVPAIRTHPKKPGFGVIVP